VRMRWATVVLALGTYPACSHKPAAVNDPQLQKLGAVEVVGKLVEIPEPFPANDVYNYGYVFRYQVLEVKRGKVDGKEIFVTQYNPLKPRETVKDEFSGNVGGQLASFRAGDVHHMALESPVDQFWMGGIIDKYFAQPGVRYWAVWTDLEAQ
jgi:hypothetical protein